MTIEIINMKKILISLYLTEIKIAKCMSFFEKLYKNLLKQGIELHLLNLTQTRSQSECITWDFQNPPLQSRGKGLAEIEDFDRYFAVAEKRDTPREVRNPVEISSRLRENFQLFCAWIDHIQPGFVFLWHQFRGLHYLAAEMLSQKEIPFGFTHLGCLPETIVFETGGEMGESWVAREHQRFRSLPVNREDMQRAQRYIEFVVKNRLDRKPLTKEGQVDHLVKQLRGLGKKIIFYAGQFDRYAGLVPYDRNSRKFHSPYYTGTFDALLHLDQLAGQNNWTLLFKPHPNETQDIPGDLELRNTHFIPGANVFDCIYRSDAVVTILSSISYLSRLHGRPTIMLGRNQISGKGCVHEVTDRNNVEKVITTTLENGYSPGMEDAWQTHIAQLLKYYLYTYNKDVQSIGGRAEKELASYLSDIVFKGKNEKNNENTAV